MVCCFTFYMTARYAIVAGGRRFCEILGNGR